MFFYCLGCKMRIGESLVGMWWEWKRKSLEPDRKVFNCAVVPKVVCDDGQDL